MLTVQQADLVCVRVTPSIFCKAGPFVPAPYEEIQGEQQADGSTLKISHVVLGR